jgi:Arc/MetJ family transcription regulator
MARVSVEVPAELVTQVRETALLLYQATAESLHQVLRARDEEEPAVDEAHLHRVRADELDDLVRRLGGVVRDTEVSSSRDVLHDVLYGALIDAGERLADASNRAWRGELPLERVQANAEEVLAIDALLRGLD